MSATANLMAPMTAEMIMALVDCFPIKERCKPQDFIVFRKFGNCSGVFDMSITR